MIVLKTSRELAAMRDAGRISARALKLAGEAVEPGVSTWEIDRVVRRYIEEQGATPSFLGYGGFPASACISVNNVVIHGIPDKKTIIKQGDIEMCIRDSITTVPTSSLSNAETASKAYRKELNLWAEALKRVLMYSLCC